MSTKTPIELQPLGAIAHECPICLEKTREAIKHSGADHLVACRNCAEKFFREKGERAAREFLDGVPPGQQRTQFPGTCPLCRSDLKSQEVIEIDQSRGGPSVETKTNETFIQRFGPLRQQALEDLINEREEKARREDLWEPVAFSGVLF